MIFRKLYFLYGIISLIINFELFSSNKKVVKLLCWMTRVKTKHKTKSSIYLKSNALGVAPIKLPLNSEPNCSFFQNKADILL